MRRFTTLLTVVAASQIGCPVEDMNGGDGGAADADAGVENGDGGAGTGDPCERTNIELLDGFLNVGVAPDGVKYFENQRDENGIYQIHVGIVGDPDSLVCITCEQHPGAPAPGLHKLMVVWHPDSEWLFVGGEIPHVRPPWISVEQDLGLMQSGTNLHMYITRPGTDVWYKLVDFTDQGYTGPAVAPGGQLYWARIVSGNIFEYTFGKWLMERGELVFDASGVPSIQNIVDLTPPDTNWVEPGTVSADGKSLVWTMDTGLAPNKAAGMDQWIQNLETGELTNINNTPKVWDEHGVFSPDGKQVVFMTSLPYPAYDAETALFGIFGLYTDFMLMDTDGSNLRRLTYFHEPGHPESTEEDSVAAVAVFSPDGTELYASQLLTGARFPNQQTWRITFAGACGNQP